MLVYGMNFQNGAIFQKRDSYELFLSISDLEFGKLVQAKIRGSGTIEIFNVEPCNAEIFADSCVVKEGLLIGFLSHRNGKITIHKQKDSYTGLIDLSKNYDDFKGLDPLVILQGYDKRFLLEEYAKLVAHQNNVISVPKPYSVFMIDHSKVEESIRKAKESNFEVLLLTHQENLNEFVKISKTSQFIPGITTKFDERELRELQKKGFEFFQITFTHDRREDVLLARSILEGSTLIAKGISPLTGVGLVDGLILEKSYKMTELMRLAVLQKFVRLYIDLNQVDEKMLALCNILNFGIICDRSFGKIEYAKSYKVEKISDQECIISYLDENNILRRLFFTDQVFQTENRSIPYLKKEIKVRTDGRSFYFYSEG